MDLREIGWKFVSWVHQTQDAQCLALLNTVMNLRVSWEAQGFLTSSQGVTIFSRHQT
jgi:hypothetical protein